MTASVYLETSIISYLSARPSRDVVVAGHQAITQEWWEARQGFALYVSQVVVQEAEGGELNAASRRLELIKDIPVLDITDQALDLAEYFLKTTPIPSKAELDALHVALATTNGLDYLLTWNCTHIANALFRRPLQEAANRMGYRLPSICTPEELLAK